jgi:ABC-type dipeptide/oligopeptide/nickel transport system ATPase subunit
MLMTKEYWLKKEKERKSTIQRFMCVWETTSLILSDQVSILDKSAKCRILTLFFSLKCDLRAHYLDLVRDFRPKVKWVRVL